MRHTLAFALVLGAIAPAGVAHAEDRATTGTHTHRAQAQSDGSVIVVNGRREMPQSFVQGRSNTGYAHAEPPQHFVQPIVDATRQNPF